MKVFNRTDSKTKRLNLRKAQTESERLLWIKLRSKQLNGNKFFRQYGIDNYIVDFYCPMLKLVIEVDGGQHYTEEAVDYDKQRTQFLNGLGIKVIRMSNSDVLSNVEGVLENIQNELPQPLFGKEGS